MNERLDDPIHVDIRITDLKSGEELWSVCATFGDLSDVAEELREALKAVRRAMGIEP